MTHARGAEHNENTPTAADLRKLADRLAQRAGAGARLTPESATLAIVALRVYADLLEQPSIETLGQPYEGMHPAYTRRDVDAV